FMARIRGSIRAGTFPADMPGLRARAGRGSDGGVAEQSALRVGRYTAQARGGAPVGSRDRPSKEAKKKPKAKSAQPSLSPLSEPPQNVELIRKPRKEKPVAKERTAGSALGC